VPYLIGAALSVYGFFMRRGLDETPAFEANAKLMANRSIGSILAAVARYPKETLIVFVMQMNGVLYYLWLIFLPTYANMIGGLSRSEGFAGHTWYFGGEADGEVNLRRKVREMVKQGADFIKVMGSGGGTVNTLSWRASYTREEMAALADEAHALDKKIAVHCLCADSIEYAVDAGVDQIEHAGFLIDGKGHQKFDPRVAEKLAKSGIPVTGTLAVAGSAVNAMLAKDKLTPEEEAFLSRWQNLLKDNIEQFSKLREAGVRLVAGTDAGWRFTPFDGLPLEMELMHRGGMSTLEALTAGTGFAAKVIGIDQEVGTLTAGLAADIIVVKGNPLDDLGALRNLQLVMQAGEIHRSA
jgi:imidazolonepropionase-like amidohydrolase